MFLLSSTCFQADPLARTSLPAPGVGLELSGGMAWREPARWLADVRDFQDRTGAPVLVHNYFPPPREPFVLNLATGRPETLARSMAVFESALDFCRDAGAPWYSFHPGYLADGVEQPDGHFSFRDQTPRSADQALQAFHGNFPALYAAARQRGVALALENLFPARDGSQTSLACTLEELHALMAPLPEDVGLLLDLGHLNVSATHLGFDRMDFLRRYVRDFGHRLFEVHLSANGGFADEHLPLSEADWQFQALGLLRQCTGFRSGSLRITLEARSLDDETLSRQIDIIQAAWPLPA